MTGVTGVEDQRRLPAAGRDVRIAVTGAAGRVGAGVVDLLVQRGYTVVGVDRASSDSLRSYDRVEMVAADLTDYHAVRAALGGCAAVVHLGAIPGPGGRPEHEVHNNNVVSSYNVLRAAVEVGIGQICQASSINAIGAAFSRTPRYDYLPIDEDHPTYNEDPYSLSKWICEQQAASLARRFDTVSISSLRLHLIAADETQARALTARQEAMAARHLWGWTALGAAARACVLAVELGRPGARVYQIVAGRQVGPASTGELLGRYYPGVPIRGVLTRDGGLFDCSAAERDLSWRHDTDVDTDDNHREQG